MELILACTSIFLSAVAIAVSIFIANNQNKIALYNKRIEVLDCIEFVTAFVNVLKNSVKNGDKIEPHIIISIWLYMAGEDGADIGKLGFKINSYEELCKNGNELAYIIKTKTLEQITILEHAYFLFNESISKEMAKVAKAYYPLINEAYDKTVNGNNEIDFKAVNDFIDNTLEFINGKQYKSMINKLKLRIFK